MNGKIIIASTLLYLLLISGCRNGDRQTASRVSDRLEDYPARQQAAVHTPADPAGEDTLVSEDGSETKVHSSVMWFNGRVVSGERFKKLLFDSHGLFVLEQLLALELVRQEAERRGISLTEEETQAEYDRSLMQMALAVSRDLDEAALRATGEQLLQEFLLNKNISKTEYLMSMERNAYLREMASADVEIDQHEIKAEYERKYGRQAVVRHIVLSDMSTVGLIKRRLQQGEDFAKLAARYSTYQEKSNSGGLLPPFSRTDERVPALMRETVFALKPNQVSNAVYIDGEFHLFRLERFIEPAATSMTPAIADKLQAQLREQKINQAMEKLARRLFDEAEIRIEDEMLFRQFKAKHGQTKKLSR